jgi:hypothetical protein
LSHLCCRNRGFSYLYASLYSVSASKKGHSRPPSLPPESPFPALSGDRFDDWLVGHQFEPHCLHHPVLGSKLRSPFSQLWRGNDGFSVFVASLRSVSARKKGGICGSSLRPKIPFPALGGDRFDD